MFKYGILEICISSLSAEAHGICIHIDEFILYMWIHILCTNAFKCIKVQFCKGGVGPDGALSSVYNH